MTVSNGPPLATAITGRRQYIASSGTIPKCSFDGVYKTAVDRSISARLTDSLGDLK